jgi:hypothetical protein
VKELLKKLLEVWQKQPLNLSALLMKWRLTAQGSNLGPEIILDTISYDPSEQSLFDPDTSAKPLDFFMNMYKIYYGIDVDTLYDSVSKVLDKYTDEFFRLVDVDKPMEADAFVERVEKALDTITAAKEQGLDVKKIFAEWDRLADEGGERLEKLPAAIKSVAEAAVREKFWNEAMKRLSHLKVPIIEEKVDVSALMGTLHTLGLIQISGNDVKIDDDFDMMADTALSILLKTRPSAMYTSKDVLDIIYSIILANAGSKKQIEFGCRTLGLLNVAATKKLLSDGNAAAKFWSIVKDVMKKGGTTPEELANAVNIVVSENPEETDLEKRVLEKIRELKEG